ncbi:hypothetical protein [Chitinilyticum piscinae]|uniref:Uncharacterized protein n=1 Tax=Chitinilyticum piscinae TaxID=2866724 RepID=A0A8J7FIK4_9NEIS|nr:hypothetical protein [Chitinilyticum piscinae]MBE9610083.1 hypothetical protein [Chitinilyticum piscinae]
MRLIWADSELARVEHADGLLALHFSAALLRDARGDEGWQRGLVVEFAASQVRGTPADWLGRIVSARLQLAGMPQAQFGPGGHLTGPIVCDICFAQGGELQLEACSASCRVLEGHPLQGNFSC